MLTEQHSKRIECIWSIAERLRGPYRPPQYRKVMLPLIVLRRLDMVLEDSKEAVCKEHARLKAQKNLSDDAIARTLAQWIRSKHGVSFYSTSPSKPCQRHWRSRPRAWKRRRAMCRKDGTPRRHL